jgi:hypothetical protein
MCRRSLPSYLPAIDQDSLITWLGVDRLIREPWGTLSLILGVKCKEFAFSTNIRMPVEQVVTHCM